MTGPTLPLLCSRCDAPALPLPCCKRCNADSPQSAYEATLAVAANLSKQRGDTRVRTENPFELHRQPRHFVVLRQLTRAQVAVYLTRLGGGVFGNSDDWIQNGAVRRACCSS